MRRALSSALVYVPSPPAVPHINQTRGFTSFETYIASPHKSKAASSLEGSDGTVAEAKEVRRWHRVLELFREELDELLTPIRGKMGMLPYMSPELLTHQDTFPPLYARMLATLPRQGERLYRPAAVAGVKDRAEAPLVSHGEYALSQWIVSFLERCYNADDPGLRSSSQTALFAAVKHIRNARQKYEANAIGSFTVLRDLNLWESAEERALFKGGVQPSLAEDFPPGMFLLSHPLCSQSPRYALVLLLGRNRGILLNTPNAKGTSELGSFSEGLKGEVSKRDPPRGQKEYSPFDYFRKSREHTVADEGSPRVRAHSTTPTPVRMLPDRGFVRGEPRWLGGTMDRGWRISLHNSPDLKHPEVIPGVAWCFSVYHSGLWRSDPSRNYRKRCGRVFEIPLSSVQRPQVLFPPHQPSPAAHDGRGNSSQTQDSPSLEAAQQRKRASSPVPSLPTHFREYDGIMTWSSRTLQQEVRDGRWIPFVATDPSTACHLVWCAPGPSIYLKALSSLGQEHADLAMSTPRDVVVELARHQERRSGHT